MTDAPPAEQPESITAASRLPKEENDKPAGKKGKSA